MTIAPEVAEDAIERIYSDYINGRGAFRLWGKDMKVQGCGCCIKRVVRFCLENCPKEGDAVSCSEKCQELFKQRQELVFDGKKLWKERRSAL